MFFVIKLNSISQKHWNNFFPFSTVIGEILKSQFCMYGQQNLPECTSQIITSFESFFSSRLFQGCKVNCFITINSLQS